MLLSCDLHLHAVLISLHRADSTAFANLDKFLRWLCANVSRQLGLEPKLDEYWDEDIGSKVSCTIYFQEYLLGASAQARHEAEQALFVEGHRSGEFQC